MRRATNRALGPNAGAGLGRYGRPGGGRPRQVPRPGPGQYWPCCSSLNPKHVGTHVLACFLLHKFRPLIQKQVPPSSVVVNTQGRESGGSWFETCLGVWYPRRRPCRVAINTLVGLINWLGKPQVYRNKCSPLASCHSCIQCIQKYSFPFSVSIYIHTMPAYNCTCISFWKGQKNHFIAKAPPKAHLRAAAQSQCSCMRVRFHGPCCRCRPLCGLTPDVAEDRPRSCELSLTSCEPVSVR